MMVCCHDACTTIQISYLNLIQQLNSFIQPARFSDLHDLFKKNVLIIKITGNDYNSSYCMTLVKYYQTISYLFYTERIVWVCIYVSVSV